MYCQPAALEAWVDLIERGREVIGEPLAAAIAADLMYEAAIAGSPPAGGAVLLPCHVAGALLGALDILAAYAGGELAAVAREQAQLACPCRATTLTGRCCTARSLPPSVPHLDVRQRVGSIEALLPNA